MFRLQPGARMSLGPDKHACVPGCSSLEIHLCLKQQRSYPGLLGVSWSPSAPKPFLGAQGHVGSDV